MTFSFKLKSTVFCALLLIIWGLFPKRSFAQRPNIVVVGKVLDQQSGQPVPYATVVVHQKQTSKVLSGTSTLDNGTFSVRVQDAEVYLVVSFIGYRTDSISNLIAVDGRIDVGEILLQQGSALLDEAVIEEEASRTTFQLDKRVFNVGSDLSSSGASALEVLNNVPSVTVNIEGQISLRGSTGVQILIDGKPSVLSDDPANALGTITADMIESIEVITNPSAKYDASGTSGILNIVLKKEEKQGLNGSISINTGIPDNHSFGLSLNRRTQKFNLFTQMGAGYRSLPRYNKSINLNRTTDTTIQSTNESFRNEQFYNVTLGADYHINKNNTITLSGNFAYEIEDSPSRTDFALLDQNDSYASEWYRIEDTEATNPKWQFDLNYKKQFKGNEDHTLLMSALGGFFGKDQSSVFTNTEVSGLSVSQNQLTNTKFQRTDYTFKLDYTKPFSEEVTMEVGGQYELNDVGNNYAVRDFIDNEYVVNASLTNDFNYDQKVLGIYGTGSYEKKSFGVKLGLRVENTDLHTLLETTNEENVQNYTNLFPSFHTSFKTSDQLSFQAGYSRRISRPRLWDLNPFFNITDNFNIRTGNPNLQPEFTDSYEITSIYLLEKASLNASVYYRYTTDVVERVSFFENNVNTTTPQNIGTNGTTGFELNGKYQLSKKITINGDVNINFFTRKGEFQSRNFDFQGEQWGGRLTSKFKLPRNFEVEVTGSYRSGYQTVQSEVSDQVSMDFGARKKLMKGKMVVNLGVRDVFKSRIQESIIDQSNFYLYSWGQRGRFITLGVSYGIGKGETMSYSGRRH